LKYILNIEKTAQKSLAKIPKPFQTNIINKVYELANNPYKNSKKLVGRDAYRIRVGNYRIIYEICNNKLVILVINIGHRKDIYKT
jgi:mRNA interferase RelE/StbE